MCKHLYGGPACVLIRPAVSSARYWNAYIIDVFHFHVVRLTLSAGEEKRKQDLITTVRRTLRSTKRSTSTKHFCCSHSPDLSNRSTRDRCSHRSRLWATMNCASMAKALRSTPTCAPFRVRFGLKAKASGQTGTIPDHPVFLATARIPARHQQQLGPLLRLIAVEHGDGSFELQLNYKNSPAAAASVASGSSDAPARSQRRSIRLRRPARSSSRRPGERSRPSGRASDASCPHLCRVGRMSTTGSRAFPMRVMHQ
jgi:hypothetical protein